MAGASGAVKNQPQVTSFGRIRADASAQTLSRNGYPSSSAASRTFSLHGQMRNSSALATISSSSSPRRTSVTWWCSMAISLGVRLLSRTSGMSSSKRRL